MKMEHKDIIDRAKMHGYSPSMMAHELLVRDLVEAAMFEWQNCSAPWKKMNEGQQQECIDRVTEKVTESVFGAVSIISSRSVDTIPLTVADAKFKAKSITVTATIDAQDPNRHGLIDVAGKLCLLVLAPNDYAEALDSIRPDRDQAGLPLHVSDITGSLFDKNGLAVERSTLGTQEDLDALVNAGLPDDIVDAEFNPESKEFGDFSYEDAAQIVVLHATTVDVAWLQRRLAIDSDSATSLLLRLVENNVITVETEADQSIDNTYTVTGKLDDVVNVE